MNTPLRRSGFSFGWMLLGIGLCALKVAAQTTVVLDDFSTDLFSTDYVQKPVPGFTSGGWNVSGGVLAPNTSSTGGYAAFTWTNNALQNVGDSFSIDLSIAGTGSDHNGGLSLWSSNSGSVFDRVLEPRLGYNLQYTFAGSDQNGAVWGVAVDPTTAAQGMTLTLSLFSRGATSEVVSATLSGVGCYTLTDYYTVSGYTGALYVGPSVWQGDGSNVTFDNLAYTSAVPEPSTYALIFGTACAGFVVWRRRRSTNPAPA